MLAFSVNDPARIFIHLLSVTAGYADWHDSQLWRVHVDSKSLSLLGVRTAEGAEDRVGGSASGQSDWRSPKQALQNVRN